MSNEGYRSRLRGHDGDEDVADQPWAVETIARSRGFYAGACIPKRGLQCTDDPAGIVGDGAEPGDFVGVVQPDHARS